MADPRELLVLTSITKKQNNVVCWSIEKSKKVPFSIQDWPAKSSMPQSQLETLVKEKIIICYI